MLTNLSESRRHCSAFQLGIEKGAARGILRGLEARMRARAMKEYANRSTEVGNFYKVFGGDVRALRKYVEGLPKEIERGANQLKGL
jgi:hypothetical protein